jgi:hypothetical protein
MIFLACSPVSFAKNDGMAGIGEKSQQCCHTDVKRPDVAGTSATTHHCRRDVAHVPEKACFRKKPAPPDVIGGGSRFSE